MSNPRTKALRGLARALMGDLTREVLNHAQQPVLVVCSPD
jgi:nucleotide-binding universal stress UspA family protein